MTSTVLRTGDRKKPDMIPDHPIKMMNCLSQTMGFEL